MLRSRNYPREDHMVRARWHLSSLMTFAFCLLLLNATTAPAQDAAEDSGQTVEQLAEEGYWGKPAQWPKHKAMLGKKAPVLELSQWYDKPLTRAKMKGKILVIDFWATWCGPCIGAIPHNNELYEKYREQ